MRPFPSDPIAAVTHANPYPYYEDLVARAPLAFNDALGLWVAASAEAVTAVLTSGLCRVRPPAEPVPRALLGSSAGEIFGGFVRMNDGPRHPVLKRAVGAALGTLDERRVAGPGREWARELAAEMGAMPEPRLVTDFAFRLPIYTVGNLLGVPREELPRLARSIGDFVAAVAPGSAPETVERGKEAAELLLRLLRSLLANAPADGLLATLAREAHAMGEDDDAILANGIGFLFQAHDATAGLIGNALLALAARPEIRHPGLLRQVLQEVIRYDPPIQNTRRFVAQDGVVAGCSMKEGEAVLVVLAAANRDPSVQDGRCFTFGIGPHACPGEALAVTIAEAGIESLLNAGIDFDRLAGKVIYRPSVNARIPLFESIS